MVHAELLRTSLSTTTKGSRSSVKNMINTIQRTSLGIAMTVGKNIPVWIDNATNELAPFSETCVRNQTSMQDILQDYGILSSQDVLVTMFAPKTIFTTGGYYTPYVIEEESYIEALSKKSFRYPIRSEVFSTEHFK